MKKLVLAVLLLLSGTVFADAPPPEPAAMGTPTTAPALVQQCRDALNADPAFKAQIANKLGIQLDAEILKVHQDADAAVKLNERHVIYAYAAMWIAAALFLIYLLFRQQSLKRDIAALRKDLEEAEQK